MAKRIPKRELPNMGTGGVPHRWSDFTAEQSLKPLPITPGENHLLCNRLCLPGRFPINLTYNLLFHLPSVSIICNIAGAKTTIKIVGKINKTKGISILTGALAAFSSIRCRRITRICSDWCLKTLPRLTPSWSACTIASINFLRSATPVRGSYPASVFTGFAHAHFLQNQTLRRWGQKISAPLAASRHQTLSRLLY